MTIKKGDKRKNIKESLVSILIFLITFCSFSQVVLAADLDLTNKGKAYICIEVHNMMYKDTYMIHDNVH